MKKDIKTIVELQEKLKEINEQDLFLKTVENANACNKKANIFETIVEDFLKKDSDSLISGIPYVLSDNISTSDILTTGSSDILKNYVPLYDATVYKKLQEAGAVLVGKTIIDELGLNNTGTTGHLGTVKNPWDETRIMGGSSAGSAAAVACGLVPFAIGSDTGGCVRKPAAYGGIVGFKPTYGRISRYGLFSVASSLDHVGYFTHSVKDSAILTNILKGKDQYDMTTLEDDNIDYIDTLNRDIKGKKLFYFKDICNPDYYKDENNDELIEILKSFQLTIKKCEELGFIVEEVDFNKEILKAIAPTYKIISYAEATSNNANLTGIHFGERGLGDNINDIIIDARTKGFSSIVKRRLLMGGYFLQKENQEKIFLNAGRLRRVIVEKMNELFNCYDGLILPATGSIAPKFEQINKSNQLILENYLALANFGGYPSITIPSGFVNNMPIAINITGPAFKDDLLLNIAYKIEEVLLEMDGDENV